jgi:GTPase KRas protein
MRDMYIKNAHGFVLLFLIGSQSSLNDIPELYEMMRRIKDKDLVPVVLVGGNCSKERVVDKQSGFDLAKKFGCEYIECDAKTKVNVNEVFESLVRNVLFNSTEWIKCMWELRCIVY